MALLRLAAVAAAVYTHSWMCWALESSDEHSDDDAPFSLELEAAIAAAKAAQERASAMSRMPTSEQMGQQPPKPPKQDPSIPKRACDVCKCDLGESNATRVVNCMLKKLVLWPTHLPANLTYLLMGNNYIETIPEDAFEHIEQLEYLAMGSNKFTELPPKLFHNNPHLRWVFMDDNRLSTLHEDIFEGASNIRELSVVNNTDLDCATVEQIKEKYEIQVVTRGSHCKSPAKMSPYDEEVEDEDEDVEL